MRIINKILPSQRKKDQVKNVLKGIWQRSRQQIGVIVAIIKNHKKGSTILGGCLIVIIVILLVPGQSTGINNQLNAKPSVQSALQLQTTQAGDYITQRLQDISDQLATIRHRLDGDGNANFSTLSQQLDDLIDQTKELSAESNKMIATQIKESTSELRNQLSGMNAVLIKLQREQEHIKYLKPSDLPFKVISIDNIQQSDVVTIDYNYTTFPIEEGSYVANWKLIGTDFVKQEAEFINAKKQHVVVNLNRMQKRKGE